MLVLSRQQKESIMIGNDVEIEVQSIRGDKVRLAITAPDAVAVHRKEVWLSIKSGATVTETKAAIRHIRPD